MPQKNPDGPRWDDAKAIEAERNGDDLKVGDKIQKWVSVLAENRRVTWRWRDGDVLSVAQAPCENIRWVALVQWHDGGNVKGWTALPQHEWTSPLLRWKP